MKIIPFRPACFLFCLAVIAGVAIPTRALDEVFITEFMAENDGTVEDEDGDTPDWIELYNAGTNAVNLNGWYLTDAPGNLTKWRFPNTNLPVNAAMIVYASNKDRRTPGRPLHTSFKLDNDSGFIALVKPDGATVQSSFNGYPQQVAGVSYGLPATISTMTLISNGAAARFTVPLSGALDPAWLAPGFDDSSWVAVTNGIGFEGGAAPVAGGVLLADSSAEFSGNQGSNNWFYGYWSKKVDANGTYEPGDFTPFPRGTGNVLAATNHWDGARWDWPAGNPPWTELTAAGGHPAGENGNGALPIHWAVRRYISETNGLLRLTGLLACSGTSGTCGDGTVGRIFVDGVEVWQRAAFNLSVGYSVLVNASAGSAIDFAIDPGAAANDACDTTTFTAAIRTAGELAVLADSIDDWSFNGAQGEKGWSYGFYNRTTDGDGTYQAGNFIAFPSGTGPQSTANYWNGAAWQWFDGEPPFDTIAQLEARPSLFPTGGTNGHEHRVIRRYVCEVGGAVVVDWHAAKKDLTGGGTTVTLFHNNANRGSLALAAADFTGASRTTNLTVQAGDTLDFMLEPGADVQGDLTFLNATIFAATSLAGQFTTDIGGLMTNINASAWLRLPFTVADPAAISALTLRLRYDDGFAVSLNGSPVASVNAPETPAWNSAATTARPDTAAAQAEEFNLAAFRDFLIAGTNVLAIQALNASAADSDLLLRAELLAGMSSVGVGPPRYFANPTPGSLNGAGTAQLGPLITGITHAPHEPADAEDLFITAKVSPTFNPLGAVRLYFRVMFNSESNVVMLDDGLHGDGLPGDGVYGAVVPNTISTHGEMVRYYVTAADSGSILSRNPPFLESTNSSQYFGTVVRSPALTNPLPVLHWFIPAASGSALDGGTALARCSLYWAGEFYDNVRFTRHGQSSTGFRKKSYNIDFNSDHHFQWAGGEKRVDDINLLNTYPDKAHMRNMLSYGIHGDAGPRSPSHFVVPVRMQSNTVFYGTAHIVENGDDNYLQRIGRDENGALYKMYDTMAAASTAEKKTRRFEDKADLTELISRSSTANATNRNWIYDNVDVSQTINFLAAMVVTANVDCCHKNYYVYRDTEGSGEWEMLPWDVDLSFGRNWSGAGTGSQSYWDDRVYPGNPLFVGGNATLPAALFVGGTTTRAMYLRRLRTLQDQLLQTNGTPAAQLNFERQMDYWSPLLTPDALMDLQKWGTWGGGAQNLLPGAGTYAQYARTVPEAVAEMKTNYLVNRRAFVFTQRMSGGAEFPDSQPTNAVILIGALEYNPASANQAQEYIQLINTNSFAVDISGWKLTNAVEHTFQGGVVLPAAGSSNTLYVVPDKRAFRNRATAPRGGQGVYVEGPYRGQLSARGETIYLTDGTGRLVSTNRFIGAPSGPQQWLRITEIMYHPPAPPVGSPYEAEDFEYLELRNTGPTNINLAGVHFTNGVEFAFPAFTLAPGSNTVIVRNPAAFASRYGTNLSVAGAYVGILDNGGETLRLDDAVGEKILDFSYDNDWYAITDGPGASLVIVDAAADWRTWDLKASWRPSAYDFGSPATADPATNSYLPVFVHEVFSHSDPPAVDVIELLNPNAVPVDLSGWFLSDDLATPRKFRVPDGTVIAAGGFVAFDENQFNPAPGVPPGFALSSLGDEVFIFSGNGTNLTGWLDGRSFGAAEGGVSFGPYTNSEGAIHFVALASTTFSNHNALPRVGPVAVSEIMYHPPDLPVIGDNAQDEFIELANITDTPVPLFDPAHPTNTWRLRSAVDFDFPTNVTLPAGGFALVVSFYPSNATAASAFRARFDVPVDVPLFGPWSGKLDNSTESIALYKPDAPLAPGGEVPYVLVERVDYADSAPWPPAADALGGSLQRFVLSAYGNDATNWAGAPPTTGAGFTPGGAPVITTQPANVTVLRGNTAAFTLVVTGTPPFAYQWQFNGSNLAGANAASLILPNAQSAQAGAYRVVVLGAGGSVTSDSATLAVLEPLVITQQPANVFLRVPPDTAVVATRTAVFTVSATTGNPPITYRWRVNGTNIPPATPDMSGLTTNRLTVTNVLYEHAGTYSCALTDGNGTLVSSEAILGVVPFLVASSTPQSVPEGADIHVSAVVQAYPPPFLYSWRRVSTVNTNLSSSSGTNFATWNSTVAGYLLTNTMLSSNFGLRLVFTNLTTGINGFALINSSSFITILADTDHDGIPNMVETALGLDPMLAGDAAADADGDGASNLDEYRAGTDPLDPDNYLKIEQGITPGSAVVYFTAVSNRTYTVEYADALPGGPWSRLGDVIARATNRMETLPDAAWAPRRFYRAVTPRQP